MSVVAPGLGKSAKPVSRGWVANPPKPYWQSGWLKQHDRLMAAMAAMLGRIPLVISGDLHAIAEGRMLRSGALDFSRNHCCHSLWPTGYRGSGLAVGIPRHRGNATGAFADGGKVAPELQAAAHALGLELLRFLTISDSVYARARAEWELGTLADG
jgi:hypothetical protein